MLPTSLSVLIASTLALSANRVDTQRRIDQPEATDAPAADPSWDAPAEDAEPVDEASPAEAGADEAPPAAPMTATGDGAEPPPGAIDAEGPAPAGTPVPASELKPPENNGVPLMIVSGGLGAVGWLLMGARIGVIRSRCKAADPEATVTEDSVSSTISDADDCFGARGLNAGLWVIQAPVNAGNWAVAPLAGVKRARYNAAIDVKEGNAAPPTGAFIGSGAALLAAGAIGRVAVVYFRIKGIRDTVLTVSGRCLDGDTASSEEFFKCYANRQTYFYLGQQFSSAAIAGGAGLLAYGITYKKRRAELERLHPGDVTARTEFSIAPNLSATYTGVSGTLRF